MATKEQRTARRESRIQMNVNTPNSAIDLLMQQPLDIQLNALLEKYLMHHASSPARSTVEKAITSPYWLFKMKVLAFITTYG